MIPVLVIIPRKPLRRPLSLRDLSLFFIFSLNRLRIDEDPLLCDEKQLSGTDFHIGDIV